MIAVEISHSVITTLTPGTFNVGGGGSAEEQEEERKKKELYSTGY